MRPAAVLLLGLMLLCACSATPNAGSQQGDVQAVVDAVRGADDAGMTFSLTLNLVSVGGDIPSGKQANFRTLAAGGVREGAASMTYRIRRTSGGTDDFSLIVGRGRLFVQPKGSQTWRTSSVQGASALFAAIRLDLVRETALLAKKVSSGSLAFQGGLTRKYVVTPADDQLEQFESLTIKEGGEKVFLKGATGEIDVFVGSQSGKLARIEVHMKGTDQGTGETQTFVSAADFKDGKVEPIAFPAVAQPVQTGDLLAP